MLPVVEWPIASDGRGELDADEHRGVAHERVMAELDARRDRAAEIVATGVDGVERGRRPEVDQDRRPLVEVMRGDGVGDPVGTHPPRVVVLDADAGPRAGTDHHRLRLKEVWESSSMLRASVGTTLLTTTPLTCPGREVAPPQEIHERRARARRR